MSDTGPLVKATTVLNIKIIYPRSIQQFSQQVIILKNYLTAALMQNSNSSEEIKNVSH